MYMVIEEFFDLQDAAKHYIPGDVFPREGYEPAPGRVEELAGNKNRRGRPVIREEPDPRPKRKRGGKNGGT